MASNRHLGRIVALQTLYEYEFRVHSGDESAAIEEILERNIDRYKETIDDKDFIRSIVNGVAKYQAELDGVIQPIAPEWPIDQIARIDRSILRLSLFELLKQDDVPPKVVINEAVELAKAFGGDNSSKFVNGVLGTAYREHEAVSQPAGKRSTKKAVTKTTKKTARKSTKKTAARTPVKKRPVAKPKKSSK